MSKVKLGDVVNILDSQRLPVSAAERAKRAKRYPYYGAQGVVDYIDGYIFDGNYVLVAEDGNNLRTLNEPIVTWATGQFWVNNHAHILGGTDTADIRFIYYKLMNSDLTGLITGSAQPKLNQANLASFVFDLPSMDEQRRIAGVISAIDDKIENNRKLMAELEATARLVYDEWFVRFDFPDEQGRPYRSSGGKMVWNDQLKREIPARWKVEQLGQVCETRLGGTPSTDVAAYWNGNIPWLNSAEVADSPILEAAKSITERGVCDSATSFAPAGSVLLSITRYIRPSILAIDSCFNQSVVAVLENDDLHCEYLYPFMQSQVPRYLTLRTGAQQPHINKETVDSTWVAVPARQVLDYYYDSVHPLMQAYLNTARTKLGLRHLRDWLLPMLMNGQITVGE